jgi:hypothetical protein
VRKVFSPLVWLFIVTLPFGMFFIFNLVWPEMGLTTDDPGSLALIQWLSFIFSGGYILGAAGIGLFTRGSARARLSFGLGASVILWVLLGLLFIVGPVVGYQNFAPDFGVIPMTAGLGLVISGLLHWNDDEVHTSQ